MRGRVDDLTRRRPLGIAIVGGLLVAQPLTLYTTPVICHFLDHLSRWLGERRGGQVGRTVTGS